MKQITPKLTAHTFRSDAGAYLTVIALPRESAFSALYRYLKTSNLNLEAGWVFVPKTTSKAR